ncbi:MAG: YitT family protein [Clostridiales bacterium]|nr:YitT family protein [Clostridiales bacterium]
MKRLFDSSPVKNNLTDVVFAIIGSALVGAALSIFVAPNDIAPGGVSGLAIALAYITPIRVSIWTLALNIPLLLCAWRILGRRALIFTLISTVLLSVFIDLSEAFLPSYTNNPLLAACCGGVIAGLGIGLLFLRGISTGGTDLLALLLKRVFPNVPSGTLLMVIDATVVAFAVLIFRDIEVALYSAITIFITSKIVDAMAQGVDYAKVIYVVTARGDKVTEVLNTYTDRGCTIIPAFGGYTKDNKQVVITVTRRNVLSQTLRLIKQTDPAAFTFVMDSTEVHGEGFKRDDLS